MWLALAVAQLHGEWPQGLPWNYAVRYAVVPGQRCAHKMPVAFATTATPRGPLYLHECEAKCTGPCAAGEATGVAVDRDGQEHTLECFCDGHCPDDSRSDCDGSDAGAIGEYAVCGSQELCQALCDA